MRRQKKYYLKNKYGNFVEQKILYRMRLRRNLLYTGKCPTKRKTFCPIYYGPPVIKPITDTYDSDATFIKLILIILDFSTTSYTIYTNTLPINLIDLKQF